MAGVQESPQISGPSGLRFLQQLDSQQGTVSHAFESVHSLMCESTHRAQGHHTVPVCTRLVPSSSSQEPLLFTLHPGAFHFSREAKSLETQLVPAAHYAGDIGKNWQQIIFQSKSKPTAKAREYE